LIPIGFEYGFRRPLHVARTKPADWEQTAIDLRAYIKDVNTTKAAHGVFQRDSVTEILPHPNPRVLLMWKISYKGHEDAEEALIILKNVNYPGQRRVIKPLQYIGFG
jgi:starch synthase (maltosyl-transferring)